MNQFACNSPVTFISQESKTPSGAEVINTIELKQESNKDIWLMRQSHGFKNYKNDIYDDLKITVDKSTTPHTVTYYQISNGIEKFSVQCTLCHSNGPRLIRPSKISRQKLNLKNKIKINYWNLIIKSYGSTIVVDPTNELKFEGPDKDFLDIKTCNKCHNQKKSIFSRNKLQRGNYLSIKHLVQTKSMPPWPYSLSAKEKDQLEKFLLGF